MTGTKMTETNTTCIGINGMGILFVAVVYRLRSAYFVIRGQVMAKFVIRGQDMLKFRSGADCSGAENKVLAVANLCFNWPNYLETDMCQKQHHNLAKWPAYGVFLSS